MDYIVTWFYKESDGEASYYPQVGGGSSRFLHSIYMKMQVPFYTTFRHYNPNATLLFFSNLERLDLPYYLTEVLDRCSVEVVTIPYTCRPPKGWFNAWMNQYYLYDILLAMEKQMAADDTLLVCDADCLCRKPLEPLFEGVRRHGSALYDRQHKRDMIVNGNSIEDMERVYEGCYGERREISYYGGEFIALRGDIVKKVNEEFPILTAYNFALPDGAPRLHEEAHTMSTLAARIGIRNNLANSYVKRMYTSPNYNNVEDGDEEYAVWHVLSEKKTGLYRLYRLIMENGGMGDEAVFWSKAGSWCGIPKTTLRKKIIDIWYRQLVKHNLAK